MKKCIGCGCAIQTNNKEEIGYALNLDQDYCQRCFRLIHYGDSKRLKNELIKNEDIYRIYNQYQNDVFVVIVEIFDALVLNIDSLLDIYKDKKVILVINKIDFLPLNVNDDKLEKILATILKKANYQNIVNCLLTYNKDPYFNELFYETLDSLEIDTVVFAGRVNAGKSSIINKLCKDTKLTVSSFPGTTITTNLIETGKYKFIDTPGLNDEESFVNYLDKDLIQSLIPLKTIKAKVFQCYDDQAYSVQGLVSIEVLPKNNVSLSFYINNMLEVHRTKLENDELYLERHQNDFKFKLMPLDSKQYSIKHKAMFYLKGLGYIKINGNCNINIKVNSKIKVYKCEVEF